MITVVQRVSRAEVRVAQEVIGSIEKGLLLLVGVQRDDTMADADVTARKVAALRIFPGRAPMDVSVRDAAGACLVISQFTLAGNIHKGNRPGFESAEDPVQAAPIYERVAVALRNEGIAVATGRFGADMHVELVNDGPVTFIVRARAGALVKSEP